MPGNPLEDDESMWFRPVWETDDEDGLDPPGKAPALLKTLPAEPDYRHPLLSPLARAQDALTRLETRVAVASQAAAEGLRCRLSYREASGWLGYAHVWIHPNDLALRAGGLVGSLGPAFRADQIERVIPATSAAVGSFEESPSDILVNQALSLARLWRQLAEHSMWRPLEDIHETLHFLGCSPPPRRGD